MTIDLSFASISRFIKKDYPELIDNIDTFLSLILISSALITGNPLTAAALTSAINTLSSIFTVKSEFPKIGKKIIETIAQKKDNDPLKRLQRMESAYCLICYAAFFEALSHNQQLSKFVKMIKLTSEEKFMLSKAALEKLEQSGHLSAGKSVVTSEIRLSDFHISLPHPVDNFDAQCKQFLPLYQQLAKGFMAFFECLAVWDAIDERQRQEIKKAVDELPKQSLEYFKALYFLLATKYEEFYVWSNLHEHEKTRSQIRKMSTYTQKYADLVDTSQKAIDLGFHDLAAAISLIPEQIETRKIDTTIKELENLYIHAIEEPIIKDTFNEDGKPHLIYPRKSEIFVPQAFKVIRYTGKEQLENEITWKSILTRNDLGAFLLSYLSSPYSSTAPLIILGHPGSGKSLLTSILAARLISPPLTPIRVELRNINAENEIVVQIEEQIYKNTSRQANWADLSDYFKERPALILFDGYDELLQASGKVFSGYLLKVQKFQENELSLGRKPVSAIVTSRITLIDKAEIPKGATIIRLLEFDQEKQNKWISIWNSTNTQYFQQAQVEVFELPQNKEKIKTLAEQPLLLLMLALYDSEGNQLRKAKSLDQTFLYDSLLRRFIERERMKDEAFTTLKKKEQDTEIERDMERLGVAAIGMFNRRTLHIQATQLDADLSFFRLERKIQDAGGRMLSQADLLLGSFFFVQESKSVHKDESVQEKGIDAAFEFLHNTFGEFLTADFILRKVLTQTNNIYKLRSDEEMKAFLLEMLGSPNGFPKDWFACLIYSPLSSRPVILDMMREWLKHSLERRKRNEKEFLKDLDTIVSNQIKRLLTSNAFPSIMTENDKVAFGDLPILGYIAIYSFNLILLRTILSSDGFVFDETTSSPSEDGTRAWDRLMYLWRSWFSLESLNGLSAILTAKREGSKIHLKAKETFGVSANSNRLDLIYNISSTMADGVMAGLSGLLSYDSFIDEPEKLDNIEKMLNSENIHLEATIMTKRIQNWRQLASTSSQRGIIDATLHFLRPYTEIFEASTENSEALTSFLIQATRLVREIGNFEVYDYFIRSLQEIIRYRRRLPLNQMIEIMNLLHETGDHREFFDIIYPTIRELIRFERRLSPNTMVELIKFAREMGDREILEFIYREYIRDPYRLRYEYRYERRLPINLMVEVMKLVRELGDPETLDLINRHYIRDLINELRYEGRLSPEQTIQIMKLAREIDDPDILKLFDQTFIRESLRYGVDHLSPGQVAEVMKLTHETGYHDLSEFVYQRYIKDLIRHERRLSPKLIVETIKFAREIGDHDALEFISHKYFANDNLIDSLTLNDLSEVVWLARTFHNDELLNKIFKITGFKVK